MAGQLLPCVNTVLEAARVAPHQGSHEPARVAHPGHRLTPHVGNDDCDAEHLGKDILDGLRTVKRQDLPQRVLGNVGGRSNCRRQLCLRCGRESAITAVLQPVLDVGPGETPLLADAHRRQLATFDHPVNGGPVNPQ